MSPRATPVDVVGKIVYLQQQYHFGPEKIAMYLRRYHDVMISKSGVWRISKRLDLNRLPASQRYKRHDRRWKRYEGSAPAFAAGRSTPRPPAVPSHRSQRPPPIARAPRPTRVV